MASKISLERYLWWRKQFRDDPDECCLDMELWISSGIATLLALDISGGDTEKKHQSLAPFSGTIVEREDIVGILTDVYAACLENADKVALSAYRVALQNVAQPLPLGRLDPEIQLMALDACTDLGFWELSTRLLRWPEQLFSLTGPLLRAVRTFAKSIHAEGGKRILSRLIAEAKLNPSRNEWRYWTLVAALDQCADTDISVQRTAALDFFFEALDVDAPEAIIPQLACQQITVALLYRMCPANLTPPLTSDQATRFQQALALLDYPTCNDGAMIEAFCDHADGLARESLPKLIEPARTRFSLVAYNDDQYGSEALDTLVASYAVKKP